MRDEEMTPIDGVGIARSVRELAHRARFALRHPGDEAEVREIRGAIEALVTRIEPRSSEEVERWLASLRRRLESGPVSAN